MKMFSEVISFFFDITRVSLTHSLNILYIIIDKSFRIIDFYSVIIQYWISLIFFGFELNIYSRNSFTLCLSVFILYHPMWPWNSKKNILRYFRAHIEVHISVLYMYLWWYMLKLESNRFWIGQKWPLFWR